MRIGMDRCWATSTCTCSGRARTSRCTEKLGAHRITVGSTTGVHFAVWAPNADRVSVIGDFNGWDGRVHAMRLLSPSGVWEIFIPDLPDGEHYKFEIRTRTGSLLQKTDPFGVAFEVPPLSAAVVRDISRLRLGRRRRGWRRGATPARWLDRPMSIYEVHLGSWARVPEHGNRFLTYRELADRLVSYVKRCRLHAHRADAGDGASVRGLVGLSGARLFCADQPVRDAGGLQVLRRRLPSGRHRRDSGLGARPFSERRARPRAFRRHGAVRARRPAAGRAPGLGHARLQLRAQRSPEFPAVERAVLAGRVPRRRAARGRGRVDALPGLLAARGRVDPEPVRRARKPRGDRLSAAAQRADARRLSGHDHRRRGIDGVAGRQPARTSWRPWFHLQVEHGLDARHAALRRTRIRSIAASITT